MKHKRKFLLLFIAFALAAMSIPAYAAPDVVDVPVSWSRTVENASNVYLNGSGVRGVNWEQLKNISANERNNVWDGANFNHYFEGYLAIGTQRPDTATWKHFNQTHSYSVRRFQGTFTIPDGFSSKDYFSLKSVRDYSSLGLGDIVAINDNIYVFIYPKGTSLTGQNYMDYMAFWTGTVGTASYNGVQGTRATHLQNLPRDHMLKHVDGWYCLAAQDNVGDIMVQCDPTGTAKDWIIDVFAEDYDTGGGMDRMSLKLRRNDTALTVKYYLGDTTGQPIETWVDKNVRAGDQITLQAGNGAGQLNYAKQPGYKDGVQQGNKPYTVVAGADNVIEVVYPIDTAANVKVVYYKDSLSSTPLGESTIPANINDSITLQAGIGEGQLDKYKPADGGYLSGIQQGTVPYVVSSGANTIDVLYTKQAQNVTVKYYKDSVGDANLLGESTIAAGVGDSITLAPGTGEGQLDKHKPDAGGYSSGIQQNPKPYIVINGDNVINVVYGKEAVKVKVNYYQDDTSSTPLGTYEIDAYVGDEITIPAGANNGQLDMHKPQSGYNSGIQQGSVPYVVVPGNSNVIDILYSNASASITVNYYKDSVSQNNLLGTANMNASLGTALTLADGTDDGQLDRHKPDAGYSSGVQQGTVPYIVVAGDNTINVVYVKATVKVTIKYFKDDTSSTPLGTSVIDANVGDEITIPDGNRNGQLDRYKPQNGYSSGVQQGTKPYVVVAGDNVINVVYAKADVSIAVKYYKDSVGQGNLLGTSNIDAGVGDQVTIAAGTDDGQLDRFKPATGYASGAQQGTVPYIVVSRNNTINVVYVKSTVKVTIKYFKGDTSSNPLGTSVIDANVGDEITIPDGNRNGQLDRYKPQNGYSSGVQQGTKPYVVVAGD
ncbi:MAG: hypothetical protein FWG30_10995, partial [Eubacteriaceae bacterium]|nr:hypothetical protein [Eubacteriaceae bacterium]